MWLGYNGSLRGSQVGHVSGRLCSELHLCELWSRSYTAAFMLRAVEFAKKSGNRRSEREYRVRKASVRLKREDQVDYAIKSA